ncbi:glycosyl transferase, partial [Francisella tularensis subsp. holarctica]|nr:glycosyl transferase [Francisella tularensis subsp. holarctica]
ILPTSPNYIEYSESLREIKVPKKVIPMILNKSDYNIDEENYKYWQQKLNIRDTRLREYDNSIVITTSDLESPLYNLNYSNWKINIGFEKFFIYIGALRYYKGFDVLIDAMQGQDYPLVIVS